MKPKIEEQIERTKRIEEIDIKFMTMCKKGTALKSAGIRTLYDLRDAMGGTQPPIKGIGAQGYRDICRACLDIMLNPDWFPLEQIIENAVRDKAEQMRIMKRQVAQALALLKVIDEA